MEMASREFASEGAAPPTDPAPAASLCVFLRSLLDISKDRGLVARSARALGAMPPFGTALLAEWLHSGSVSPNEKAAMTASLPPHQRLLLANRLLRTPLGRDGKLLQWARTVVQELQSEDPEEALLFLQSLHRTGDPLSPAAQRALARGRLGVWLQQLLKLDLDAEQLTFMTETAPLLGSGEIAENFVRHLRSAPPDNLVRLLASLPECGDSPPESLARAAGFFLKHEDDDVRLEALRTLFRLRSDRRHGAFALLYRSRPALRPAMSALLLTFSGQDFRGCLAPLDGRHRAMLMTGMAACVAVAEGPWLKAALKAPYAGGEDGFGPAAEGLAAIMKAHPGSGPPVPPASRIGVVTGPAQEEEGVLGKVRAVFEERGEDRLSIADVQAGQTVSRQVFEAASLFGIRLGKSVFEDCTLTGQGLAGLRAEGPVFRKTVFRACVFSEGVLKDCTFEGCTFADCDFSGARVSASRFSGCSFTACDFSGAVTKAVTLTESSLTACSFAGARILNWRLDNCSLRAADFSGSLISQTLGRGIDAEDCLFHRAAFHDSSLTDTHLRACGGGNCFVSLLSSDAPLLRNLAEESASRGLIEAAGSLPSVRLPACLGSPKAQSALFSLLSRRFLESDARRQETAFLEANRRRLDWSSSKLGAAGDVFDLIPALLVAPWLPEKRPVAGKAPAEAATACAIRNYRPGPKAKQALRSRCGSGFPLPESPARGAEAVMLEGVYAIGSLGSIAQTRASDIDLWICHGAGADEKSLSALRRKLDALELWFDAAMHLEVHFFLMDTDSIRANEFGFSDEESAGSTQAMLLKEEFYRTAMLLAGRRPLWWRLPAGAEHDALVGAPVGVAGLDPGETVSLGPMQVIDREEFFGASLWQLTKALKSPFKSILKLALLDHYLASPEADVLLCNRIRDSLAAGARGLWRTDPYAVLFREVYEHCRETHNEDAAGLIRDAFLQKTGYDAQSSTRPPAKGGGRESSQMSGRSSPKTDTGRGNAYAEYFFPADTDPVALSISPSGEGRERQTFSELLAAGERLGTFMFDTYRKIHDRLSGDADGASARIEPEDLTRIGRRLAARFESKPEKVERVMFLEPPQGVVQGVEFTGQGAPGAPGLWAAGADAPGGTQTVRRDGDLVRLLAWLHANAIVVPGTHLRAHGLQSPVSLPDIQALLEMMFELFPHGPVFDPPLASLLEEERITRLLIAANITAQREDRVLRDVSVIYATSWGEMFCTNTFGDAAALTESAAIWAGRSLSRPLADTPVIRVFTPRRSQCPKIPD